MRLQRIRTTCRATSAAVFRTLADWHARAEVRRKREERKAKHSTHYRRHQREGPSRGIGGAGAGRV